MVMNEAAVVLLLLWRMFYCVAALVALILPTKARVCHTHKI